MELQMICIRIKLTCKLIPSKRIGIARKQKMENSVLLCGRNWRHFVGFISLYCRYHMTKPQQQQKRIERKNLICKWNINFSLFTWWFHFTSLFRYFSCSLAPFFFHLYLHFQYISPSLSLTILSFVCRGERGKRIRINFISIISTIIFAVH